jgi:nitrite reductase (NADH) large subunit
MIEGRPIPAATERPRAFYRVISPDYFQAMGIPLRHGNQFTDRDSAEVPGGAIINDVAARKYWPGEDPLRKRIKRFTFGEFGHWRAVHAVLGALTLVVLVSHTGFRLGHNFNFVLMTNFLALALMGALAGAITALERRLQPASAKRLRAFWTGTHVAMAWPLPVLIFFHVLMAYYF